MDSPERPKHSKIERNGWLPKIPDYAGRWKLRQNVSAKISRSRLPRTENPLVIRRLQAVHLVVDDINARAKEIAQSDYEPTLDAFSAPIGKLLSEYSKEYDRYRLDEIVIAAIAPTVRTPSICNELKLIFIPPAHTVPQNDGNMEASRRPNCLYISTSAMAKCFKDDDR